MITQGSVAAFLDDLASAAPTPGGGSAAAVVGAMSAALVSMVCNVTLGKKGQEAVESEMKAVRDLSERLRTRLTAMAAADIAAFDGLMAAYRLPKASEAEKQSRGAAIQDHLRAATETPSSARGRARKSSRYRDARAKTGTAASSATPGSPRSAPMRPCEAPH